VSDSVSLDEKTGNPQKEDEEEAGNILFLRCELVGPNEESANDGHHASHKNEKAEELQKEIEEGPHRSRFELMGEGKNGKGFAPFHQIAGSKPLEHVHDEGGYEAEYQQRMGKPTENGLSEKLPMENNIADEDLDVPPWSGLESPPSSSQEDLELLPFGGIFRSLDASLQPNAYPEAHPPQEEDHRGKEHQIEDEVFVHGESQGRY
jgi:hypothetical protein